MVFSSVTFLFYFLPIFLAAYVLTPTVAAKNVVTLMFSLVFYAWGEPRFLLILLFSIAFNYGAALLIDARAGESRKWALAAAVAGNLLVLGLFKYANFVTANFAAALKPLGLDFGQTNIELPLGISFFTFHCLSYVIDVYRRRFGANRDPVDVALYISLFPQLVAGPIVRYKTVARQLDRRRQTLGRASAGARIFIIGLAQKVLIADLVAPLVAVAFDHAPHRTAPEAWIGLLSYTIQIYFDFAGYSNMAIGLGIVLGFTFPRNFNLPYTALSITEFWRRWHMSLSSWLRDYLYVPLGGNRGSDLATYRNLVTVFVLCGVWHGANWTFVLWGVWHGAFLVVERLGLKARLARLPVALRWAYALLAVMGGWVLFRAADLTTAGDYFASLLGFNGWGDVSFDMHDALSDRAVTMLAIGCLIAVLPRFRPRIAAPALLRAAADAGWTFALLIVSMITVAAGAYSPFLYFKF
ncbi:D-alanyl-lipoteichoic acid acyltransferase DltB (MBOAT superfamily) [Roseiarcus fermentans]|uniref:Probable alginate O-acetylase AlgI n=1 Tax=Roseiarcus fermentans TaxID=1473586 RepID=A0A366FLC6_9HYPH|nr:MBOAT family protein [Roseiarcus fermentans]RBP15472.1 D-alanyl-lipoteichoic acid acyltransferase DltB (MBOAT superfamily) [Roseiarcus fermentans]